MISKTNLARFQGKVFLLGTIVIAVLIVWSLFGTASGNFVIVDECAEGFIPSEDGFSCVYDSNIPFTDIFGLLSTLLNIPFQLLVTIAVLIVAIIIAIPIILIARRLGR